jgi:glycosyltransferase involved in cell wall biosynthesis
MSAPAYTVVIPCYNGAAFLPEALESLNRQTFRDFEAILVDDGSTDASADLAGAFPATFPLQVIRQANGGPAAARNRGIGAASGTFIAFLDGDDAWEPNKLERVHRAFTETRADLVCHDERFISGGRILRTLAYGPSDSYADLLFKGNCLSTSAVTVRREIVNRAGGFSEDREIAGVEDYDLWMRLAARNITFFYLHEVLGTYRLHPGGLTSQAHFDARELTLLERHFAALDLSRPDVKRRVSARRGAHYAARGYHLISRGEVRAALSSYRRAFAGGAPMAAIIKYVALAPAWSLAQRLFGTASVPSQRA